MSWRDTYQSPLGLGTDYFGLGTPQYTPYAPTTTTYAPAAATRPTGMYTANPELDWVRLNKIEIAQRVFPPEVFEAYTRPELTEAKFKAISEQEKKLINTDIDELLRSFIEIIDDLKLQMMKKVDVIIDSYSQRFRQFNQSVDQLSSKASDMLKRLESENQLSINNTNLGDQLTRDIELMKLKRQSVIKSEEILTQVKNEIERERMLERFQEFKSLTSHQHSIYDEKVADGLYRRLVADLSENLKSKPTVRNLEMIRDPHTLKIAPPPSNQAKYPLDSIGYQGSGARLDNGLGLVPPPVIAQPASQPGLEMILQQNHSMIDRGLLRNPKGVLERTYLTTHKAPILAVLALNNRYVATSGADRTVFVWDLQNQGSVAIQIDGFTSNVHILRKVLVDQAHPLGHLLLTASESTNQDNLGVFDITSPASAIPSVLSRSVARKVSVMEVLNQQAFIAGYASGELRIYETKTMNILYQADLGVTINALLVLPDRKTFVVACDNEYSILETNAAYQITTKAKRRDTATFGFLRSLGRNSEVFCGFLKNGMIKMYRTYDGECLNVILGQRGEYDSGLVLNFFSADPNVYLLTLARYSPYFRYCNIDDTEQKNAGFVNPLYSVAQGDPKMQILDLHAESHILLATVANVDGKQPGIYIWRFSFN